MDNPPKLNDLETEVETIENDHISIEDDYAEISERINGQETKDHNKEIKNQQATSTSYQTSNEPYSTILGLKVNYSDAKAVAGMEIVEVWGSYLPDGVLGMTDCTSKIWIRYGLGYLKKHVLIHEIEHVKDPAASEYIIRLRAKQREPAHYIL